MARLTGLLKEALRDNGGSRRSSRRAAARELSVQELEQKLWGGFANLAVEDLEEVQRDPSTDPVEAVLAARTLARFHAVMGRYEAALRCLSFVTRHDPEYKRNARILEIYCLMQLGKISDARELADQAMAAGIQHDGCMNALLASTYVMEAQDWRIQPEQAAAEYLEHMSRPLRAGGHVGLKLKDSRKPLSIYNLAPESKPPVPESMPAKVSVLMAVYNGADNAQTAIRSILQQSWRNLELVIVDDASTDGSWDLIQDLASGDSRIVAVRHESNGGAYVARNTALAHATGDYVVVNDADDWAHPQKIEAQVSHLLRYPNVISNMTFRVRVAGDMTALPRLDSGHVPVIHNDYSALMLKRERAIEMGGWDTVRFGADAEFVERLCVINGPQALQRIRGGMPLSFSLWEADNLTTTKASGILTNRFGSRLEYVRQFREWHGSGESLKMDRTSQFMPFPAPGLCYLPRGTKQEFDVVLVADIVNGSEDTVGQLELLRQQGLRVSLLPWQSYSPTPSSASAAAVTLACREKAIPTLVHGEVARCKLVIVQNPALLMQMLDQLPEIYAERVIFVQKIHESYDPPAVQENSAEAFGKYGTWMAEADAMNALRPAPAGRSTDIQAGVSSPYQQ